MAYNALGQCLRHVLAKGKERRGAIKRRNKKWRFVWMIYRLSLLLILKRVAMQPRISENVVKY